MGFWGNIWNVVWTFFWIFAFISYLFALFAVIADLFRDRQLNVWWKALWIICLVFIPFLTVLVYLIARGRGMAERNQSETAHAQTAANDYIRSVASSPSAADEIAKAKGLLDAGTITQDEYSTLKTKALAGQG